MVDFHLEPSRTALIVVDLQNCFVEGYPVSVDDGPRLVERLNRLADVARDAGVQVVYTVHQVRRDHSNVGVLGILVPAVADGLIDEGSESAALHPGVTLRDPDILLVKPRFGAFHATDLELILRDRGIDTVIIGGIATNLCCETTAREANARDFQVLFLGDGTATFDLPDTGAGPTSAAALQEGTCATLGFAFAQVLSVDQAAAKIIAAAGATAPRQAGSKAENSHRRRQSALAPPAEMRNG